MAQVSRKDPAKGSEKDQPGRLVKGNSHRDSPAKSCQDQFPTDNLLGYSANIDCVSALRRFVASFDCSLARATSIFYHVSTYRVFPLPSRENKRAQTFPFVFLTTSLARIRLRVEISKEEPVSLERNNVSPEGFSN